MLCGNMHTDQFSNDLMSVQMTPLILVFLDIERQPVRDWIR